MKKVLFNYHQERILAATPEEAIAWINGLSNDFGALLCNPNTEKKIRTLFDEGTTADDNFRFCREGQPLAWGRFELAPKNIGTGRIYAYPPLGETLEAHQAAYEEQRQTKEDAERQAEAERQARREREDKERREVLATPMCGWYGVAVTFSRAKFGNDGIYYVDAEFYAEMIASSGADAYRKTVAHLEASPDVLPDSYYPSLTSDRVNIQFLGVKVDGGYSVERWQQAVASGEIDPTADPNP